VKGATTAQALLALGQCTWLCLSKRPKARIVLEEEGQLEDDMFNKRELAEDVLDERLEYERRALLKAIKSGTKVFKGERKPAMASRSSNKTLARLASFHEVPPPVAAKKYRLNELFRHNPRKVIMGPHFGEKPKAVFQHEGSVEFDGDLLLDTDNGKTPAAIYVIDGDLHVSGTLEVLREYWGMLHVTGSVRARNVLLNWNGRLSVAKDLVVENLIASRDGCEIYVQGTARAKAMVYHGLIPHFLHKPEMRIIVADPGFLERQTADWAPFKLPNWAKTIKPELAKKTLVPPFDKSLDTGEISEALAKAVKVGRVLR
jgi:hypothetical protein